MDSDAYELAMFPLGQVLVPTAVLPLHVFEPRYRAMMEHLMAETPGDQLPEFGVVLIERGSEVGGDDARTDAGTVARIIQSQHLDDGRWGVVAIGHRRIRVVEWLADDPWPKALVVDWPDPPATPSDGEAYSEVVAQLRGVLALAVEMGADAVDATPTLSEDTTVGSYQVAALAPFGPHDRQRMLTAGSVGERLAATAAELADQLALLEQGLRLGDDWDGTDPEHG